MFFCFLGLEYVFDGVGLVFLGLFELGIVFFGGYFFCVLEEVCFMGFVVDVDDFELVLLFFSFFIFFLLGFFMVVEFNGFLFDVDGRGFLLLFFFFSVFVV